VSGLHGGWPHDATMAPEPGPGYAVPPAPGYGYPPGRPLPAPRLPSRVATVLITLFFGLFGLIPAYLHGKQAERQGVSPGRYYVAFAITLVASIVAYAVLVGTLVLTVFATASSTSSDSGTAVESAVAAPVEPEVGRAEDGTPGEGWVADWGGQIQGAGERSGAISLQMGWDGTGLLGGVYYDDLGCSGMWTETSRDGNTVTVSEVIESDPDWVCRNDLTLTLTLDVSGQMVARGDGWTAFLQAYPD
jgi:hypothetical protein